MPPAPLRPARLRSALRQLPGWRFQRHALVKTFVFADFRAAFAFMLRVAFAADRLDHHPAWTNVYGTVQVRLNTHAAGGRVTALDAQLAAQIEKIALVPPAPTR